VSSSVVPPLSAPSPGNGVADAESWAGAGPAGSDLPAGPGVGSQAIVVARELTRRYGEGDIAVDALAGVSVEFSPARFAAIMGPSGSGKSTLMHILAGLDRPTSGTVTLDGIELGALDDKALTLLRREKVGFIFQTFNLLPILDARENILLPLSIAGRSVDQAWFDQLIDAVGIRDRLHHRPAQLSGGQQQRVAVARALVSRPAVVFADEPTGNLDSGASGEVLELLRRAVDDLGQTVVMVTHDAHAAAHADRLIVLADGRIVRDGAALDTDGILDLMKSLS
jgi:putative ABC transport system ATP-binding protein